MKVKMLVPALLACTLLVGCSEQGEIQKEEALSNNVFVDDITGAENYYLNKDKTMYTDKFSVDNEGDLLVTVEGFKEKKFNTTNEFERLFKNDKIVKHTDEDGHLVYDLESELNKSTDELGVPYYVTIQTTYGEETIRAIEFARNTNSMTEDELGEKYEKFKTNLAENGCELSWYDAPIAMLYKEPNAEFESQIEYIVTQMTDEKIAKDVMNIYKKMLEDAYNDVIKHGDAHDVNVPNVSFYSGSGASFDLEVNEGEILFTVHPSYIN